MSINFELYIHFFSKVMMKLIHHKTNIDTHTHTHREFMFTVYLSHLHIFAPCFPLNLLFVYCLFSLIVMMCQCNYNNKLVTDIASIEMDF